MKISEQWLRELLPVDDPVDALAERLTMAGLEVDSVTPAAPPFEGVVVAEIVTCEPHPQADRLQVCSVEAGSGRLQIVCGAPNARPGLKAPLATVGAVLPGDFRVDKAKLRGVESLGMLCSVKELGLADDAAGLMELPSDAPVGADLRDYLGLDDQVIEVDLTPNRSDCLGMTGIAREISALTGKPVTASEPDTVAAACDDTVRIQLDAPHACPRYAGRVVRDVDVAAPTPLWMRERLRRAGIRSLGPVVDVTNYVMIELGQPMHAFDLDRVEGGIHVRMARDGESIELLNDETVSLDPDTLVIADASRPLAMAGIMGGAASAVSSDTRDILLESAFFSPLAIAGRARSHGLHTDSSHRFERGVDPQGQVRAIERATALLIAIAGGVPGPVAEAAENEHLPVERRVGLRPERIEHLLGVSIPFAEARGILERLGMRVSGSDGGPWNVMVPAFRFDIGIEVDLIEELARVWGYDRIPLRHPATPVRVTPQSETRVSLARVRQALVDRGYQEAVTYSFVDPRLQELLDPEQEPLSLANPISSDLSVMRSSLWPGLVAALIHNRNRQHERLRLFETGLRFRGALDTLEQTPMLGAVITGDAAPEQWGEQRRQADFFDIKGDLEALLVLGGSPQRFRFRADRHPALHPGQSACIVRDGRDVGWIGAMHPAVQQALDLDQRVFLFELELAAVQAADIPAFRPLSRFPSIRRDLALVVDESVDYDAVAACIRSAAGDLLQDLVLFDVYQGRNLGEGRRSLGIGLILQDFSRTLTDSDVESLVARVIERLDRELNAQLRG